MGVWVRQVVAFSFIVPAAIWLTANQASAQTDYYNTDHGRPITIEDAYPTERYAFELKLAPVRLEREAGIYQWGIEPEIAYGIFARTHLEVGFPLIYRDEAGSRDLGLAGIDVSFVHNLNAETQTLPALGVSGSVLVNAGSFAPARTLFLAKGLATRTFSFARFHANAAYTFGSSFEPANAVGAEETSRWLAGIAVDKTYPLRALLITAELYARAPLLRDSEVQWNTGAGIRYQVNPRLAVDGGIGKKLSEAGNWFVTFGTAYAFGVRSLMPSR